MKIAKVIGPPFFLTGLGQTRIIPISVELIKKGHEICVFTPTAKFKKVARFENNGVPVVNTGQYFFISNDEFGFTDDYIKFQGLKLISVLFKWVFSTIKEVKKFNPDVIQIYTSQPNVLMFLLFARIRFPFTKIYIDYDDIYGGEGSTYDDGHNSPTLLNILAMMEKYFPVFANKLTVCSHFLANKFNSDTIIPNSVDTELLRRTNLFEKSQRLNQFRKELGLSPEDKIVLIVSRLKDSYDYDMVIKAVKTVYEHYKKIKVLFVGDGIGITNLKKLVQDNNLDQIIHFKGFVKDQNTLKNYYHIADISIIPMRERVLHLARCPIKLLDCIAAQLCIIVPDYAECKYILKDLHDAIFYKVGDIEDLASKLLTVLNSPELENQLRKNLSLIIDTYDHKHVANLWEKHLTGKIK